MINEMVHEQVKTGKLSLKDADTLLTFQEFLERAGPPPVNDVSPGLKKILKTKKWRQYMGIENA